MTCRKFEGIAKLMAFHPFKDRALT